MSLSSDSSTQKSTIRFQAMRAIVICLAYDALAAFIAMVFAIEARHAFEWEEASTRGTLLFAFELSVATVAASFLTGVYRQVWRHTTASDLRRVLQTALLANLIFLPVMFMTNRLEFFFRSSLIIEVPILVILMVAGRLISRGRATGQLLAAFRSPSEELPPALLVGEADLLASALRDLAKSENGMPIRPLGIIEVSGEYEGLAISGVQVFGDLNKLDEIMSVMQSRYGHAPWIAIALPPTDRQTMDAILEIASRHGTTVQRLRKDDETGFHSVSSTDLLSRPERKLDTTLISQLVSGARVFVTGAGGTIGSELVRQCAALGPTEITLYDSSEYNLYEIDMEMARAFPNLRRKALLGDVREEARLFQALTDAQPDIVIHAAALKHVPLMELNPNEAILTNVEGARLAAKCAASAGVSNFVFISTDKAVNPTNVMGASKRTAELFLQAFAPTQPQTCFSIVRFGNVLGSAGSVVPLFERQIEAGGPVTVTHEDMTRYFMSVEEAASLVMQAAALSSRKKLPQAQLYVLDMGEPVNIVDMARRMIRLKGLQPDRDIDVMFTGLRPGEKLSESVFYAEESVEETEICGVLMAKTEQIDLTTLDQGVDRLVAAARRRDRSATLEYLEALAPELSISSAKTHDRTDSTPDKRDDSATVVADSSVAD